MTWWVAASSAVTPAAEQAEAPKDALGENNGQTAQRQSDDQSGQEMRPSSAAFCPVLACCPHVHPVPES